MSSLEEIKLSGNHDNNSDYLQANLDYCTYYCNNYVEPECKHESLPESEYNDHWTHLELGAGNYGLDGHTKISQNKTVLMSFKFVSNEPNYIDKLPLQNSKPHNPFYQYHLLFKTLDDLVLAKGPKGIFHVNDLYKEYATYAAITLKKYSILKEYNQVIIQAVSGDYSKLIAHKTLSQFDKKLYDSIHLKNPEESFYHYGVDGEKFLSNEESRENARNILQKLANLSYKKFNLFINPNFYIPSEEREEYIDKGIFYHHSEEEAVPYVFPEGDIVSAKNSAVYDIKPNYKCS
ncbi:MAG: hypothetical protein WBJ81_05670 [Rickettsiales bacterium]